MPTLEEVLSYLDPKFASAPQEKRQKVLEKLKGNPEQIDRALSYLDPKYAQAPKEQKAKVLKAISDVPFYEKLGRAFAYGSGEFVEDLGQIIKEGTKLLEKGAELITGKDYEFETPIADKLVELGQEAKEYWRPEKYSEVYDFTGSGIVEEVPSLIGFGGAIGKGAKLGSAVAKKALKREGLTKAVAENVGAGLGYSATQVAAGDYTGEDVARDVVLDTALGAGGYQLGRLLRRLRKKEAPIEQEVEVKAEEPKEVSVEEVLNSIEPAEIPKSKKRFSNLKEAVDFFEENLLGKEIETPIGLKVRFDKRHFLNIISGGKKKGFVEGAKTPEESYELIKQGVEPEKIRGYEAQRARDIFLISDILSQPHVITKDKNSNKYVFYKEYKSNGNKGYATITVDSNGSLSLVSFHRKSVKTILNKVRRGEEEIIWTRGLSPGRTPSATGYAPGELTDGINNNLTRPDDEVKFYSGGPSSEQLKEGITKLARESEDPLAKAQGYEELDPFTELAKADRQAIFANWTRWILPQYEWLKKSSRTAGVYRAAKEYTEGLEKDLYAWLGNRLETLKKRFKGMSDKEKERVIDVVEGKLKNADGKTKEIAKEIRSYLDDIYNYVKEQGLDISYREDYFPHLFEGNIRVKVGDEFVSTKTWDEALEVATKGLEEGKDVKIRAFLRPDIYEVKITNPRFWKLVNNLEQGVELTKDEVKQLVKKAGVGNRPRYRFVGNLLQRKYNIDGYIKDPETALSLYTFTLLKKLHQDRFLKEFEKAYQNVPSAKLRQLLDEYKEQVLGYPTKGEQITADIVNSFLKTRPGRVLLRALNKSVGSELSPFQVRKAAGISGYWANYVADLGLSASSAAVNSTQVALNVAPVLGVRSVLRGGSKYIKGLIKGDEKIKKELFDAGVLTETGFENMRASAKDYPLIMFKAVEVVNRVATYGATKDYAKRNGVEGMLKVLDVLGVSKDDPLYRRILDKKVPLEEKAIDFAREVVDKTQFRYEKFAAPRGLSGSIAKLLLPYKNFLINQILLSARMATKNAIKHPREALQFFGAAMLIGGVAGNPILNYGYEVIDWLYREQTGKSLEDEIDNPTLKAFIKGGLPLVAGIDIRSSVKIDVPTSFRDLLGRPGRLAMALAEGDPQKIEREIKPRIYQNIEDALQMYKTGYVKDSKGRVIDKATTKDAALRALGLRPRSYYEFLEKKEKIYVLETLFRKKYEPLVNSLAGAIVNGDEGAYKELYAEITDRLKYLANKVQSSEGEVKKEYMYLYLKLSSAISREGLMRRVKNRIDPFGSDRKKKMLLQ